MQTAKISTAPEDYLTPEELAEARELYERLCLRIRSALGGRLRIHGDAGPAKEHITMAREQVTASRRAATDPDAAVYALDREWRSIASLARRETTVTLDVALRLVELAKKMRTAYAAAARIAEPREDELLYTDSTGDRLCASPPRGRHGTLLYIRPGEGELYLPTPAVDVLRAALKGEGPTGAVRAQLLNEAAEVASSKQHNDHAVEDCTACSMAAVIAYELRCMADAALAAELPPELEAEPVLPRTTAAGRFYLRRFARETVYVWLGSSRPGNGVGAPALERLLNDGLVIVGDPEPGLGRPIALTDLGHAVLTAHPEVTGGEAS